MDDLNNLMNVVHNIKTGGTVRGNVKASWQLLEFKGDQIDFEEFSKIHNAFPRLFEPAFRLQQLMIVHTTGELWWNTKKREVQDLKEEADLKIAKNKAKKEAKRKEKKNRVIRRNMGLLKYYFCACYRDFYDPASAHIAHLTAEEKLEREKQIAIMKRQAELKLKNPETADWLKYQKKVAADLEIIEEQTEEKGPDDKAGSHGDSVEKQQNTYLDQKIGITSRPREERAIMRAERKKERKRLEQRL